MRTVGSACGLGLRGGMVWERVRAECGDGVGFSDSEWGWCGDGVGLRVGMGASRTVLGRRRRRVEHAAQAEPPAVFGLDVDVDRPRRLVLGGLRPQVGRGGA